MLWTSIESLGDSNEIRQHTLSETFHVFSRKILAYDYFWIGYELRCFMKINFLEHYVYDFITLNYPLN